MPQEIDWTKLPDLGQGQREIDLSNLPSLQEEQPGFLRRSWDWLTSPVSMMEPFVERQAKKVGSFVPEGQYREDVERLTRENVGGVLSPLGLGGELGAGLGGAVKIGRSILGKGSKVVPEVIKETTKTGKLVRPGSELIEEIGKKADSIKSLTPQEIQASFSPLGPASKPRMKINTDGTFSPIDTPNIKYDNAGKLISKEDNLSIKNALEVNIPEIQQAAEEVVKTRPNLMTDSELNKIIEGEKEGTFRKMFDPIVISGWTQLENMGGTGKELSRFLKRTRAEGKSAAGTIISNNRASIEALSKKEFETAVDVLESGVKTDSVKITNAVNAIKSMIGEVDELSKGLSVKSIKGGEIPFEATGQFPRKFQNNESIVKALVDQGMPVQDAIKMSRQVIKGSVSPTEVGALNLPDFLKTKGALYEYIDDMATRAIEFKNFGKDNEFLNSLIKQTNDPETAGKIVQSQLGRVAQDPNLNRLANAVNTFEATVKLPLFAISNMNQAAAIGMRTSTKEFIGGLVDTLKNVKSAEDTGALQATALNILRETGQNPVTRLASRGLGWQKSEEFLRSWAANSGRAQANEVFNTLKKNPNDKTARAKLDDLLLEDVNKVLTQKSLTDQQRKIAGFRMSELTQGLVDPADLPPIWTASPLMKIPLMFKRFAFQQNKILKDSWNAMKTPQEKAAFLSKALALYTITGEVTGDIKAGISAGVSGQDPLKAIQERGEGVDRIWADISNAYALGLVGEIIGQAGSGSTNRMLKFLTGPAISDLVNVSTGASKSIQQGSITPLGRELTRITPLGYATSRRLFPTGSEGQRPIMGGK